ncbi:MAG: hypothetical protein ACPG7F_14920, partial [Aggregatilineales bacterium]
MKRQKVSIFVIIILLLLCCVSLVISQDAVDVSVLIEEDSLVVSITETGIISLQDFTFEVTVNGENQTWRLQDFSAFQLSFGQIPAPICFRLSRAGTTPVLPQECEAPRTLTQILNPADVFWFDRVAGQFRTLFIPRGVFCGAGQSRCDVPFIAPIISVE